MAGRRRRKARAPKSVPTGLVRKKRPLPFVRVWNNHDLGRLARPGAGQHCLQVFLSVCYCRQALATWGELGVGIVYRVSDLLALFGCVRRGALIMEFIIKVTKYPLSAF